MEAVEKMSAPINVKELKRFLGGINWLSKFIHRMTHTTHPRRNLLKEDVHFAWSEAREKAFENVKKTITNSPVLGLYAPVKQLTL